MIGSRPCSNQAPSLALRENGAFADGTVFGPSCRVAADYTEIEADSSDQIAGDRHQARRRGPLGQAASWPLRARRRNSRSNAV